MLLLTIISQSYSAIKKKPYYSCIMTKVKAMITSSTCNVIEWIEYNIILGFDHIYITDDCSPSSSNLIQILMHYESQGYITIIKSYNDYIECEKYKPNEGRTYKRMFFGARAKENCEWITNIDYDEYITFYDAHYNNINNYLLSYPYPYIRMPWFVYNNYGYESKPNKLLLDSYYSGSMEKPRYIKTMTIADAVKNFQSPHLPNLYNHDVNSPLKKRVHIQRSTEPSGVPNNTLLNNKYWINGCHNEEMKQVNIEKVTTKKTLINTLTETYYKQMNETYNNETYNNYRYNNIYRNSIPLDNNTTVYIPATEIFIKHFKYLSWEEYKLQRASTPTLPNGRYNYWKDNARAGWGKGNKTIYHNIKDIEHHENYTIFKVQYYEIDINIATLFSSKMITLLTKGIDKRIKEMKINNTYNNILKDCHFR